MALEYWNEIHGDQEPRRYFDDRELSAIALGFLAPENGSAAVHRAVRRAIHELIDSGAITRLRTGGQGLTSEFELMLDSSRPAASHRTANDLDVLPFTGRQGATD